MSAKYISRKRADEQSVRQREKFPTNWANVTFLFVSLLLTIFTVIGNSARADEVVSNKLPTIVMKITPTEGNAPLTVQLDATESHDTDGNIVSYSWLSNDDQEVTNKVGTMSFEKEGIYSIDLKVQDNNGGVTERTSLVFVDRELCPGATAFNQKTGILHLPVIDIIAEPAIGRFIEPALVISTINADIKLNRNNGLFDITRVGQDDGVFEGIMGGHRATYVLKTNTLTIPGIDLPVRSEEDGTLKTLGTNTFTCTAKLIGDSGPLEAVGCSPTSSECVTIDNTKFDSSPISDSIIDFGKLPIGESFDKEIRIINQGKSNLQITSIAITGSDMDDFKVSSPELTVPGNSKETLVVTCQPQEKGERNAYLELITNDPKQPNVQYKLSCTGSDLPDPYFYSVPTPEETTNEPIDFGTVAVDSSSVSKLTVVNRGKGELQIQHIQVTGKNANHFSVSPTEATISNSGKGEFELVCTPTSEGEQVAFLAMVTNDREHSEVNYKLSCTGKTTVIEPPVTDKPVFDSIPTMGELVDFGEVKVDETSAISKITIMNRGKGELQVTLAQITGKDASHFAVTPTDGFSLSGNSSDKQVLEVTCTPTSEVEYSATLELITNDPTNSTISYELACTGSELPPVMPIFDSIPSPSVDKSIDLGTVELGKTSSTNKITVLNRGSATLQVSDISITGQDADQFVLSSDSSFNLLGDSSNQETVELFCAPTKAGTLTATLVLSTNDSGNSSVSYPLSCQGSEIPLPKFDSIPSADEELDLGSVTVGDTSVSTDNKVVVLNRGSVELQVSDISITGQEADQFALVSDSSFNLAGNSSNKQTLEVTCTPTKTGEFTATLELVTNDLSNQNVSYRLSCNGIDDDDEFPILKAVPEIGTLIDFETVELGVTSLVRDISIKNQAKRSDLQIDEITITGQDKASFALLSDVSLNVSGSSSETLELTCTPAKVGKLTATLEFKTNDPENSSVSYSLSCIGEDELPLPQFSSVPLAGESSDFGEILLKKISSPSKITIENLGKGDLDISDIEIIGDNADQFDVLPTSEFRIKGNSSGKKELKVRCKPTQEGIFSAELQLSTNDANNAQVSYPLSCEGKEEPDLPIYSAVPILKSVTTKVGQTVNVGKITVKNSGGKTLNVNVVGIDSDSLSVSPNELSVLGNSAEQKELLVSCTPISVGQHSATLTLQTNDLTHETVSYPLSCKVCEGESCGGCTTTPCPPPADPVFTSSPEKVIDFGEVDIDATEPSTQDLVISNSGKAKLTVNYFNIEGLDAKLFKVTSPANFLSTPLEIAASGTQTVTFECTPKSKGDFSATLKLKTNDPKFSIMSYQLKCSGVEVCEGEGCGGDPIFTSSPDSGSIINFGDVGFNSVAIPGSQDIKIKNLGSGNLKVDFFNIEGANANIFKVTSPTSLAIKSSEMDTMTLQCAPKNSGDFSATLKLSTNDPKLLAPSYQLKCTGSDCLVDMDPDRRPEGGVGDLGFGYDSDRDLFKLSCLEGTNGTATGTPTANLDLSKSYTFSEVLNEMGFEANAKVKAKVFQLDTSAKFAMQRKDTSLSQTMFFTADYKMPSGVFHPTGLTKIAESIKNNSCQFRNACGDEYVNQTVRGAKLYVAVSFDFNEQKYKKSFEATLGAKYKIVEIAAKLSTLSQDVRKAGRISISAVQVGGKVEELAKLLGGSATQNAPVISCSLDNLPACEKMLNTIYQYAQNQFAAGATTQPATLGYYTLPYTSVGVPSDKTKVTDVILQARKYLVETYKNQYADLQVVRGWITSYGGKMSEKQLEQVNILETLLTNNTEVLQLAGMWCLSNLDVCVAKKEKAEAFVNENLYKLPELMLDDPWESETRGIVWQVSNYKGEPVDGKTLAGTTTNLPRKIIVDGSIKFPVGTVINTNDSLFIEATGDIIIEQGASISVKSFNATTGKRNVLVLKAGKTVDLKGSLNAVGAPGVSGANGSNGYNGNKGGNCKMGDAGGHGSSGSIGEVGTNGGLVYIKSNTINGNASNINVSGGKGGNGGNGGNGGRGGDGGKIVLTDCGGGGRSGGNGGNGGSGGNGSNGADGGTVVIRYCSSGITGQPAFAGGAGGSGGAPGQGGAGGSKTGNDSHNGSSGPSGAAGSSGQSGKIGENVPLPLSSEVCPAPSSGVAIIGIL